MGSNAQSTAWAIQGLDAVGISPAGLHRDGAVSPLAYLDGLTAADGAVSYARGVTQTPVWVTGEALMALAGKSLPLAPLPAPGHGGRHGAGDAHPATHEHTHPATHSSAPTQRHGSAGASTTASSTTASPTTTSVNKPPSSGQDGTARGQDTRPAGARQRASARAAAGGSGLLIALGRAGGQTVTVLRTLL